MAIIDNINGVPLQVIEAIPIRTVILDKKKYSARYDQTNGIIYYVDDQGNLTGDYKKVTPVAHKPEPESSQPVNERLTKKELKKKLAGIKAGHPETASRKVKSKTASANRLVGQKTQPPVSEEAEEPRLFHPKAFIVGMAIVLAMALGYFLYSTGGIL